MTNNVVGKNTFSTADIARIQPAGRPSSSVRARPNAWRYGSLITRRSVRELKLPPPAGCSCRPGDATPVMRIGCDCIGIAGAPVPAPASDTCPLEYAVVVVSLRPCGPALRGRCRARHRFSALNGLRTSGLK